MRKVKLSHKILSSVLALLMIFTSFPVVNTYAATDKNLGQVSAITKPAEIGDNGQSNIIVKYNENIILDWSDVDETTNMPRTQAGWWVGIKMNAPALDSDVLKNSKYKSLASFSSAFSSEKSFWEFRDSKDDEAPYITLWSLVTEEKIAEAIENNEGVLETQWQFDWNYDEEFAPEQTVTIKIDSSKVKLMKDGEQVYPVQPGTIDPITAAKIAVVDASDSANVTVSYKDTLALDWSDVDETTNMPRSKAGWWAGIKMTAPNLDVSVLEKATYDSMANGASSWVEGKSFWENQDSKKTDEQHYITLWTFVNEESLNDAVVSNSNIATSWRFDWNNDGIIDQIVTTQIDPSRIDIVLNKDSKQVYPATGLGLVEGITGKVDIDENKTNLVTASYSDKVTLQWSQAKPEIGRNADGWWAGIKMTAPTTKVSEVEGVKYQSKSYGSDKWQTTEGKNFWGNQDSDKNNRNDGVERYITLWAYVKDQSMLNNAKENSEKVITQWRFDWDADGVYEQYVNFELDPNKIVLDWSERYKLDTEAPVIIVNDSAENKEKVDWSKDSATITGTITDIQDDKYASGIKDVYCLNSKSEKLDGFEYNNKNGEFSLKVTEEGELEYTIVATDNSGKETTQKVYAKVDKTDPVISKVEIESESAKLKAVNEPQVVKIYAEDKQSGIKSIVVDGKDVTKESEFEVTENGTYTVEVTNGVDKSSTKEIVVNNFDNAAPSASLNLPDDSEATWIKEVKEFFRKIFKLKDGETSIDSIVTLKVEDVASPGEDIKYSKITEARYYLVNVDENGKSLEDEISKVTLDTVKENGIPMIVDGKLQSPEIELYVGETVVFVYAKDEAGNVLFNYSDGFVFEETKPEIYVENDGTEIKDKAAINNNNKPNLTISVQDAPKGGEFVSGIQEVTLSVNGVDGEKPLQKVDDPDNIADGETGTLTFDQDSINKIFDLSQPGIYDVVITAKDMCNNTSTFTFKYMFDNIKPKFSGLDYKPLKGETDWSASDSVTFNVTDFYTNEKGEKVQSDPEKVEYAVAYTENEDIQPTEWSEWSEVQRTTDDNFAIKNFAIKKEDVKDGEYTMYVAVRYKDDCGNEVEPSIQKVAIKKDTTAPTIEHFELSVDKNNAVEGFINVLSFGTLCKESIILKVYAKDSPSKESVNDKTAGLYKYAHLEFNKDGEKVSVNDMKLSSDELYYEYNLELSDTNNESFTYSDISVVVSDNYTNDGTNGNSTEPTKLNKNNTIIEETSKGTVEELNDNISDIILDNIAPEISEPVINSEVISCEIDKDNIIFNDALVSTIPVSDANSGISKVTVNVVVNGKENKCDFDVYKDNKNSKINEVSFAYNAKEHTVTEIVNGNEVNSIDIGDDAELAVSDNNEITLTVNATDNAGNPAEEKEYKYTIDNKAPEVTKVLCENKNEYTNENVKYTFKLNGEKHFKNGDDLGVSKLVYSYNEVNQVNDENISASYDNDNLTKELSADGKYSMKSIRVVDLLGNETTAEIKDLDVRTEFVIDSQAPTVRAVHFKTENNNEVINFFKYGIFANDVVTVTATIENANKLPEGTDNANVQNFTAPLDKVELFVSENVKETNDFEYDSDTNCWTAKFNIDLNEKGLLKIDVKDKANNSSSTEIKSSNNVKITYDKDGNQEEFKQLDTNFFLSENTKPIIEFEKSSITGSSADKSNNELVRTEINKKTWFNKNVVVPVHIEDPVKDDSLASGIYEVDVTVNDQKVDVNPTYTVTEIDEDGVEVSNVKETIWDKGHYIYNNSEYDYNKAIKAFDFNIDTSKYTIKDNASYVINVVVTDFAGNSSKESFTIYKDIETPYVDFQFSGVGNQDSLNKDGLVELVELKKSVYGYYFVNDTKVTVTTTDENCDKSKVGVKSITYYAVDINNGIVISGKDVSVDEDNKVTFTVPANFKGQIYAYATDNVGNNFSTALTCKKAVKDVLTSNPSSGDSVQCVIPDKTIVENAAQHSKETHISYEVITKTDKKDASGLNLYKKAVDVKVTITDTYSGIRSGSVVVTSDENSNNESSDTEFDITKDMNSSNKKVGKTVNGWTIDNVEGNLVTQISKVIRITRNSNNILVSTSMTDRAGNKTNNVKLKKFSIDTVAPEITVRYSNNSESEGKYFKADRTATITVKERNFDPALVTAKVNGKNISLKWSGSYASNTSKEGKTYTAKFNYNSDGDYKFGISCKDRAGNADKSPRKYTGQVAPTDFVIDKTAPKVTVTNTSTVKPEPGNYYSKPVKVTIEVKEHNWNPGKFKIIYAENDKVKAKELSWSNNGDIHTATFTCDSSTGIKYTIDYDLADRAANNAVFVKNETNVNDYKPDEFYVDQTVPEIRFKGAVEGSHNNGTIESGILLSDTYYDHVEVTLTGKRRGVVLDKTYTETDINITEFVETTRNNDDYYTISVTAYDKAGNHNANPITRSYSVNRKGSMFVLSSDAKKLNEGTNSQNVVNSNIVIYEYNVDKTVSEQVELWKNGNVTKLSRGNGYTISTVENQNGYICNTYSIASNLFADDAAYRIYITTKDEAGNTSTNTSKNSAALSALDKNDGSAPVLSFIKDTTPPVIDINLDITKADSYYSIKQDKYVATFTIADAGSGLNLDSVLVTYGNGDKAEIIDLIKNEDKSYSIELNGTYRNLRFTFTDNAGNEFNSLVFNSLTVSANPFVRLVANTPLFIGLIVAIVAVAIIIIILIAKKKKDDDKEENKEAEISNKNK